ncbi:hypothetical protein [Sphingobium lactosutens]|uniref:hypothetical protein n=1 Tax=Sphingobium lactosutens TaxID=522773 RepID=UPI0015BBD0B4|nr:hypothetical protein [Sphingobium lactosutens]
MTGTLNDDVIWIAAVRSGRIATDWRGRLDSPRDLPAIKQNVGRAVDLYLLDRN